MQEATRELYWNISGQWIMYFLFGVVVACFAIFFYRRYRLWKLGAPEDLSDNKKVRFFGAFKEVFTQKRVVKKKSSGIMHLFIFWGMLFLFVATALTTLQDHFGIPILYGPFYLYFFSLGIDLAASCARSASSSRSCAVSRAPTSISKLTRSISCGLCFCC